MSLQPLTPAGVAQKVSELYALSDNELKGQASIVASNFKSWLSQNFQLDPAQTNFLATMNNVFASDLGKKISVALDNKLPIKFVKPPVPQEASKFISTKDTVQIELYKGNYTASGDITITIGYRA